MTEQYPSWVPFEHEGFGAYNSGSKRRDCPYDRGTPEAFYWQCGWFNALTFDLYRLRPWPLDFTMSVH